MHKLSSALNTHFLSQAHAQGWRKDRIKHRNFLFQSLLKLANKKGELQLSAREIAQLTDLSPARSKPLSKTSKLSVCSSTSHPSKTPNSNSPIAIS